MNILEKLKPTDTLRFIISKSKSIEINVEKDCVQTPIENNRTNITIDTIFNRKKVTKTIELSNLNNLKQILEEMKNTAKFQELEFYPKFPKFKIKKITSKQDKRFEKLDFDKITNDILFLHKKVSSNVKTKSVQSIFEYDECEETFIEISKTYKIKSINPAFTVEVALADKSGTTFDKMYFFHKKEELQIRSFAKEIIAKLKQIKDSKEENIDSQKYDLIFPQKEFAEIISHFIISNTGLESHIKADSYLNQNILFDKKLNIFEDPFVDYSPNSTYLDSDFVPTCKKEIIKDGKYNQYLTTLQYAFKYKKEPTGNALDSRISNLFVKCGNKPYENLIKETKKGLIIYQILGLHTTNSKEGSFNVVVPLALEVENGKIKKALKNISLNENFVKMLQKIDLSKETNWFDHYNVPHLFCRRN